MSEFKLYVVRNAEGMFFRAKGRDGRGKSWVNSLDTARIYGKIRPARATISWYANNVKDMPTPQLVEIIINENSFAVLDETKRIEKMKEKRRTEKERNDVYRKRLALEHAERAYEQSKEYYEKLRRSL